MRLFVALPLEGAPRDAALAVQRAFRARGVEGNYTKPENLHLTLAFIGEYPDPEAVLEALAGIKPRPFELSLSGLGAFGDLWWLGAEPAEPLAALARRVRHALSEAGIPFDRKKFSPHITLLRRARPGPNGMPGIAVPRAGMTARRAVLYRSDRGKEGMIYTEVGEL